MIDVVKVVSAVASEPPTTSASKSPLPVIAAPFARTH